MWIFDRASGKVVMVNDAAIRTYGYSREEFAALRASDICAFERPTSDSLRIGPGRHARKNGSRFDADLASIDTGDGTHIAALVMMDLEPKSPTVVREGSLPSRRRTEVLPTLALVDPRALTESVCARVRERADAKQVGIVIYCSCERVWLRTVAFAEALYDLLDNAVAVSRRGHPVIIDIRDSPAGDVFWEIHDAGDGMPEDPDQEPSAPSGVRLRDASRTSSHESSHARAIVEDHGGQLRFESTIGVGTTASVWLPARR